MRESQLGRREREREGEKRGREKPILSDLAFEIENDNDDSSFVLMPVRFVVALHIGC